MDLNYILSKEFTHICIDSILVITLPDKRMTEHLWDSWYIHAHIVTMIYIQMTFKLDPHTKGLYFLDQISNKY